MPTGHDPGEAGAPIMPDQMKALVAVADRRNNVERVLGQQLDAVAGMIRRVGPRIFGIAPLIRGHGGAGEGGVFRQNHATAARETHGWSLQPIRRKPCRASSLFCAYRSLETLKPMGRRGEIV